MPDPELAAQLNAPWLALVVGNTRLHWGLFHQQELQGLWHTPHCTPEQAQQLIDQRFSAAGWRSLAAIHPSTIELPTALETISASTKSDLPLYCASVVPMQTALWQSYSACREVTLEDLPLPNLYPTLGIDRALNLLGAGDRFGWPILVIDAGTALTFTAGTSGQLLGGAILPGLATQFSALAQKTAALPPAPTPESLPPRWAINTDDAMRSGIIYGTLATIADYVQTWRQQYTTGKVVLTGGDGAQLYQWWCQLSPVEEIFVEPALTFWGLHCLRQQQLTTDPAS